jgi:hypothetical protein
MMTRQTKGGFAAVLLLAVGPAGLAGQWGDLRLEVGGSRAFAASGTNLDASTYLTAALQADRWTPSGSGVFAGVFAGMATDSIGGDWASMVLGGRAVAGSGGPVEFHLSGSAYGFVVAEPFAYKAYTVTGRPEIHIPVGRAAIVFYGEGGKGSSTIEFRRTDQVGALVRAFDQDLWHYGGGPEVRLRLGRAIASVSAGVLETDAGTYHRGEVRLRTAGSNGSLIDATLRVWDTPLGNETTGTVALTIPVGRSGWFTRLVGGRTDPDPLVQSEPGGQGGLVIGRRLVRFGPTMRTPIVRLDPMAGGATARFRVESAQAQSVEVLGDFSSWEPREMAQDGRAWMLEMPLTMGTYHFGFLVDGEWFVPADAPGQVSDDWGQTNATIVVP